MLVRPVLDYSVVALDLTTERHRQTGGRPPDLQHQGHVRSAELVPPVTTQEKGPPYHLLQVPSRRGGDQLVKESNPKSTYQINLPLLL